MQEAQQKLATSSVELEVLEKEACAVQGRALDAESECCVLRARLQEQDQCIHNLRVDVASYRSRSCTADKLASDAESRLQACFDCTSAVHSLSSGPFMAACLQEFMKEVSGSSSAHIAALTEQLVAARRAEMEKNTQLAEANLLLEVGSKKHVQDAGAKKASTLHHGRCMPCEEASHMCCEHGAGCQVGSEDISPWLATPDAPEAESATMAGSESDGKDETSELQQRVVGLERVLNMRTREAQQSEALADQVCHTCTAGQFIWLM